MWHYDASGELTDSYFVTYTYDAAGDVTRSVTGASNDLTQVFDGDGRVAKTVEVVTYADGNGNPQTETHTAYYVHSSVLGGVRLTELGEAGQKRRTFVYAERSVLAWQVKPEQGADYVRWEHRDTSNASYRTTDVAGAADERAELDPLGNDVGAGDPYQEDALTDYVGRYESAGGEVWQVYGAV